MDPINRNIQMKYVAGFHPFLTLTFPVFWRSRSGLGTRLFQNSGAAMVVEERTGRIKPGRSGRGDFVTRMRRNAGARRRAGRCAASIVVIG